MSSSRRAEPPRAARPDRYGRRWRTGHWSLRTKLLVEQIALLALVCLIIGLATELSLRAFLIHQSDTQIVAASNRAMRGPPPSLELGSHPFHGPGPEFLLNPGNPPGSLGATIVDGQVREAAYLDSAVNQQSVPAVDYPMLAALPANGQCQTLTLHGLGDYRVVAVQAPDGQVMVSGMSLAMVDNTLVNLGLILAAVVAFGLLVAAVAGAVIVRRTLRPLRRVADTAARVAELPLHHGDVALPVRVPDVDTDPRTEVGQVGAALNRMLGHIAAALTARQASETRVRQFVADASHELRTPLAAIRGYAELTRRSRGAVPPEVAHAIRRVESESARMTTLVDDLLLLARLDSGRPLDRGSVDLSRLVVDAVSDAHIAGPEHNWRLDLPEEPVLVAGDGARLHQVLANLLSNARTHTPAGSTVVTGLALARAGQVLLTVADDGPGIPPDLLPEVFERFARGDTSRSRAAGSTGLGLAIVAAVVAAHHGTVEVTSRPGRTVFTVRLPRDTTPS